jgi:hypothetical protein
MNDGRETLWRCDIPSPTTIQTPADPGNPHAAEGVRAPEDFLRALLSGTAAREHGRERRKKMFRISRIAEGSGSRQADRMRKGVYLCASMEE